MADLSPILVGEDEETDLLILQLALKKAGVPNPLVIAKTGTDLVRYLRGDGPGGDRRRAPLPALILLDLNMPGLSGLEVLAWMQGEPALRGIPAVVLSSSDLPSDIKRARQLGAAGYQVKPSSPLELVKFLRELRQRWLTAPALRHAPLRG